jgi:hypothetical protein
MKKLSLALLMAVIAVGCVKSPDVPDISYVVNSSEPKVEHLDSSLHIRSYVIGTQMMAYIGQPIASWQDANRHSTVTQEVGRAYIEFENNFRLTGNYINKLSAERVDIKGIKGDKLEVICESFFDGQIYHVINVANIDERHNLKTYGLLIDGNGILNSNIITDKNQVSAFVVKESALYPPDAHFKYYVEKNPEKKVEETVSPDGEIRELIFGGVNDVSINVTYREYTQDNLARPAFYQNLTYQTSAQMIRFRDFNIKVHEVTKEKIVYTVLEDGLDLPTP